MDKKSNKNALNQILYDMRAHVGYGAWTELSRRCSIGNGWMAQKKLKEGDHQVAEQAKNMIQEAKHKNNITL